MGQVPNFKASTSPIIGIIGRGRAARHLGYYFEKSGITALNWHRGQSKAEIQRLEACHVIVLAISDSQIEEFVLAEPWLLKKEVLHLSGALNVIRIKGAHPLVSFGSQLFDLEFYKRIPFIIEAENPFDFARWFPRLPNPVFKISREQKARYHALCVVANNFTTMLWQKYYASFHSEFGIPEESSSALFESTFLNIKADWRTALTGPIVRGDTETIQKNISSLNGDDFQEIYLAFLKAQLGRKNKNVNYVYLEPGEMGL